MIIKDAKRRGMSDYFKINNIIHHVKINVLWFFSPLFVARFTVYTLLMTLSVCVLWTKYY